jgi:protein-arginine kinase activator protein McsA
VCSSDLSKYIFTEQYEKIAPIKERIKKLEFKINSQK